jgi:hypothetical protein
MRRLLGIFAFASALVAASANANPLSENAMPRSFQEPLAPPPEDRLYDGEGESSLDVVLYTGSPAAGSLTLISPLLDAWFELEGGPGMSLALPFVYSNVTDPAGPDASFTMLGNLALGGWVRPVAPSTETAATATVGLVATVPTAFVTDTDPERAFELAALGTASAARGFRSAWLWLPERGAVVVPVRLSFGLDGGWRFGASAAVALTYGVADEGRDLIPIVELAPDVTWTSGDLRVGVRVTTVFQSGGLADDDALQVSVEPFVRFEVDTLFFGAALTVDIDPPAGFSFADGGIWGAHLLAGAAL